MWDRRAAEHPPGEAVEVPCSTSARGSKWSSPPPPASPTPRWRSRSTAAPSVVSRVLLPDQSHTLQRQRLVDAVDGFAFGRDHASKATGRNDMRRPLHLEREPTHERVD